jgi:hypothetical protein
MGIRGYSFNQERSVQENVAGATTKQKFQKKSQITKQRSGGSGAYTPYIIAMPLSVRQNSPWFNGSNPSKIRDSLGVRTTEFLCVTIIFF